MPHVSSSTLRRAVAALALVLTAVPLDAAPRTADEHCTREDVASAEPGATADRGTEHDGDSAAAAINAETAHALPAVVTAQAAELPTATRHGWWPARFADHLDVGERLKSFHSLRLLRLWDSARVSVFLGVDRHGVAGLHLEQQGPGNLPPERVSEASLEVPPLRAVPLSSP